MAEVSTHRQMINRFRATAETNYIFACEAAVPMILTPDLLYQLWNNFKHFQYSFDPFTTYKISHTAVSDLLVSNLCREVGYEMFEIKKEIRLLLLEDLVATLGHRRKNTIATFLQDYALMEYRFPQRKNLKDIHTLTAKSLLDPSEMERQIIELINKAETDAEKMNYLLLHHQLIPVGFESDLSRISREVGAEKNTKELSPVLIVEADDEAPGVMTMHVHLPEVLRNNVVKVRSDRGADSKKETGVSRALDRIRSCLQTRDTFLNLSHFALRDADWEEDSPLDLALKQCLHLTVFTLEGNDMLTQIPPAVFSLTALEKLRFGGTPVQRTKLTHLPESIVDLTTLQFLDLSYNELSAVPRRIGRMERLVGLNLQANNLQTLPSEVGNLRNLKELYLNDNQLQSFPETLLNLTRLRELQIQNNPASAFLSPEILRGPINELLAALFPQELEMVKESEWIREGIGGTAAREEVGEAIQNLSVNRTLMALKLTEERPITPIASESLETIEQVFTHFHPAIEVTLLNDQFQTLNETFIFNRIDDFSPSGLVLSSKLLKEQDRDKNQYQNILRQLKTNKVLRKILASPDDREKLQKAFIAVRAILDRASPIQLAEAAEELEQMEAIVFEDDNKSSNAQVLETTLTDLRAYGGFDLLTFLVPELDNFNPARKARQKIALEDPYFLNTRYDVIDHLLKWIDLCHSINFQESVSFVEKAVDRYTRLLDSNLVAVMAQSRGLEQSYRTLDLFYKNAELPRIKNLSIVNAHPEQLADLDEPRFMHFIRYELQSNFDRFDLQNNYSLLILPGFLHSTDVIHRWAKIAHEFKVMLITDFRDLETTDEIMSMFEEPNLTGGDLYLSNTIMTCNWLVGRQKNYELGEEEDIMIPGSTALGGRLYSTLLSQVTAGKKFGSLNSVEETRLALRKSEISTLEKLGLVPMVKEYGKVMAFSAKTLFTGDNIGLQTYTVTRTFDYITKVMMQLLNTRAFEFFSTNTQKDIRLQMVTFLNSITGPSKSLEAFQIRRFEKDPDQKDKLDIDILVRPFFPAKDFLIQLSRQSGDDGNEWRSRYIQLKVV